MAAKVFYSGTESIQHYQALMDANVPRILQSYFYTRGQKGLAQPAVRKSQHPNLQIMMDSGGYSLQTLQADVIAADPAKALSELKRFLEEYIEFLLKNKHCLFSAVELDVEHVVGYSQVHEWQKEYFQPLEDEDFRVIYIWHENRGLGEWESMCRQHRHVGVNELVFESMDAQTIMQTARKYLASVHGFALTRPWVLDTMGLDTCDSITWKSGERFGTVFIFENGKLLRKKVADAPQYKGYIESLGIDYAKVAKGDYKEITRLSIQTQLKMEHYFAAKNTNDYYEYRLPHPDAIDEFTTAKLNDALQKFAHIGNLASKNTGAEVVVDGNWLKFLAAVQNGLFHEAMKVPDAINRYLAMVGLSCPLSITNIANHEEIRKMFCLLSAPSLSGVLQRTTQADFKPVFEALKRENPIVVQPQMRPEIA